MTKNDALLRWCDLSAAERLYLDRIRRGEDATEAAQRHGVTRKVYERWEMGADSAPLLRAPKRDVALTEAFVLLRRRSKYSQAALAAVVGRSRAWVNAVECGRAERCDAGVLVEFWRAQQDRQSAEFSLRRTRNSGGGGALRRVASRCRTKCLTKRPRGRTVSDCRSG